MIYAGPLVFSGVDTVDRGPIGRCLLGETKHSAFRLGEELVAKLEREAKRQSKETGFKVTRTDVLKRLITEHCGKRSGAKGGSKK